MSGNMTCIHWYSHYYAFTTGTLL